MLASRYDDWGIKTLEDVRKVTGIQSVTLDLLTAKKVSRFSKKWIKENLDSLVDNALWQCEIRSKRAPSKKVLEDRYREEAEAKALYRLVWCLGNISEQMVKYGWDYQRDQWTLINRMVHDGADPWSTTEPTVGDYIHQLEYFGRKKVTTESGEEFFVLDPKGRKPRQLHTFGD